MYRGYLDINEILPCSIPNGNIMDADEADCVYFIARNPNVTAEFLAQVRGLRTPKGTPVKVGLMYEPSWYGFPAPQAFAQIVHDDLNKKGIKLGVNQCRVILNLEIHDWAYILKVFKKWRELRTQRWTEWALEYHQGGWIDPQLVDFFNRDKNMRIVQELYLGTPRMFPASEGDGLKSLMLAGLDWRRIFGFFNGETQLPVGWEGIVWDFAARIVRG